MNEKARAMIDRYRLLYGDRLDRAIGQIQSEIFAGESADDVFCFRRHIEEILFLVNALVAKCKVAETPPAAMN